MNKYKLIFMIVFVLLVASSINAYKVDPPNQVVHQYITNESGDVWKLLPYEMRSNLKNLPNSTIDATGDYDWGDDIIIGSGEEDKPSTLSLGHFWNPDDPRGGNYSAGLSYGVSFESSYERARRYWISKVIPNYILGKEEKAYYWLGHIVHLLEDATVPAHVHLDIHPGGSNSDNVEEFTVLTNDYYNSGSNPNYKHFKGTALQNKYYKYENLIPGFNWNEVDARHLDTLELFRLFWYTAQKTQNFSSNDEPGNSHYVTLTGTQKSLPNMWANENPAVFPTPAQLTAEESTFSGPYTANITQNVVNHSMKAVAGLYRLFWDAVKVDWPTYQHDNRRTGFTLLKGDFDSNTYKNKFQFPGGLLWG